MQTSITQCPACQQCSITFHDGIAKCEACLEIIDHDDYEAFMKGVDLRQESAKTARQVVIGVLVAWLVVWGLIVVLCLRGAV